MTQSVANHFTLLLRALTSPDELRGLIRAAATMVPQGSPVSAILTEAQKRLEQSGLNPGRNYLLSSFGTQARNQLGPQIDAFIGVSGIPDLLDQIRRDILPTGSLWSRTTAPTRHEPTAECRSTRAFNWKGLEELLREDIPAYFAMDTDCFFVHYHGREAMTEGELMSKLKLFFENHTIPEGKRIIIQPSYFDHEIIIERVPETDIIYARVPCRNHPHSLFFLAKDFPGPYGLREKYYQTLPLGPYQTEFANVFGLTVKDERVVHPEKRGEYLGERIAKFVSSLPDDHIPSDKIEKLARLIRLVELAVVNMDITTLIAYRKSLMTTGQSQKYLQAVRNFNRSRRFSASPILPLDFRLIDSSPADEMPSDEVGRLAALALLRGTTHFQGLPMISPWEMIEMLAT